ncbi:MAG: putative hemolysin [Pseudohongiellaceae bacterium]
MPAGRGFEGYTPPCGQGRSLTDATGRATLCPDSCILEPPPTTFLLAVDEASSSLGWWTAGLAALSFLLAALEHGWTKLPRTRLADTSSGPANRNRLERMLAEGDRVEDALIVLRVGTQVTLVMVLVVLFQEWVGPGKPAPVPLSSEVQPLIMAGVTAFLWITLFCRVLPGELSSSLLESLVRKTMTALVIAARVLGPPIGAARRIARLVTGHTEEGEKELYTDEMLSALEEGEREGHLAEDQADMIERVLELRDTEVRHLMTPRTDMDIIDVKSTVGDVRLEVQRTGRSRYPLVEETVDSVVGILHVKDLLGHEDGDDLRALGRDPRFIPETKFGTDLLTEFRSSRAHLAIVLDEYGGTAGLVTIEDVLEEIVGEIDDEFDEDEQPVLQIVDDQLIIAPGAMHVDEINEQLSIHIPESDDWSTLGGYIFHTLGRLPLVGEELQFENLTFQVEDVANRRINRVRIQIQDIAA